MIYTLMSNSCLAAALDRYGDAEFPLKSIIHAISYLVTPVRRDDGIKRFVWLKYLSDSNDEVPPAVDALLDGNMHVIDAFILH
jgi:hypothetical protein